MKTKIFNKKLATLALSGVMATSLVGAVGAVAMRDMLTPNHTITAKADEVNNKITEQNFSLTKTGNTYTVTANAVDSGDYDTNWLVWWGTVETFASINLWNDFVTKGLEPTIGRTIAEEYYNGEVDTIPYADSEYTASMLGFSYNTYDTDTLNATFEGSDLYWVVVFKVFNGTGKYSDVTDVVYSLGGTNIASAWDGSAIGNLMGEGDGAAEEGELPTAEEVLAKADAVTDNLKAEIQGTTLSLSDIFSADSAFYGDSIYKFVENAKKMFPTLAFNATQAPTYTWTDDQQRDALIVVLNENGAVTSVTLDGLGEFTLACGEEGELPTAEEIAEMFAGKYFVSETRNDLLKGFVDERDRLCVVADNVLECNNDFSYSTSLKEVHILEPIDDYTVGIKKGSGDTINFYLKIVEGEIVKVGFVNQEIEKDIPYGTIVEFLPATSQKTSAQLLSELANKKYVYEMEQGGETFEFIVEGNEDGDSLAVCFGPNITIDEFENVIELSNGTVWCPYTISEGMEEPLDIVFVFDYANDEITSVSFLGFTLETSEDGGEEAEQSPEEIFEAWLEKYQPYDCEFIAYNGHNTTDSLYGAVKMDKGMFLATINAMYEKYGDYEVCQSDEDEKWQNDGQGYGYLSISFDNGDYKYCVFALDEKLQLISETVDVVANRLVDKDGTSLAQYMGRKSLVDLVLDNLEIFAFGGEEFWTKFTQEGDEYESCSYVWECVGYEDDEITYKYTVHTESGMLTSVVVDMIWCGAPMASTEYKLPEEREEVLTEKDIATIENIKNILGVDGDVAQYVTAWIGNKYFNYQFPVYGYYDYDTWQYIFAQEFEAENMEEVTAYIYLLYQALNYSYEYAMQNSDCFGDTMRTVMDKAVSNKECMVNLLDSFSAGDLEWANTYLTENYQWFNAALVEAFGAQNVNDFYTALHNAMLAKSQAVKENKDASADFNAVLKNMSKAMFAWGGIEMDKLDELYAEWLYDEDVNAFFQHVGSFEDESQIDVYVGKVILYSFNTYMTNFKACFTMENCTVEEFKGFINEFPPVMYEMFDMFDAINYGDNANIITLSNQVYEDSVALYEKIFGGEVGLGISNELAYDRQIAIMQVYDSAENLYKNGTVDACTLNKLQEVETNLMKKTTAEEIDAVKTLGIQYVNNAFEMILDFDKTISDLQEAMSGVSDGVTPQLRINSQTNEWEVSYDNGTTWTSLGVKATGANGSDGTNGTDGTDGVGIQSIEKTSSNGNVDTYTITLTNGDTYTFTVTNGVNGVKGDTGATGATGAQGIQGESGNNGVSIGLSITSLVVALASIGCMAGVMLKKKQ